MKHIAGKSIGRVDSLSKRADWVKEVKENNENQIMLIKEWLEIRTIEKGQLLIEKAKNNEVVKTVEEIKKTGVKVLRNNK